MNAALIFYLCPTCFYASETPDNTHEHGLLRVGPGCLGDARRKPITDREGLILSPAPYWFHEAILQKWMSMVPGNPDHHLKEMRHLAHAAHLS